VRLLHTTDSLQETTPASGPTKESQTTPDTEDASDVTNVLRVEKFDRSRITNPNDSLKTVNSSTLTRLDIEGARRQTVRITEPSLELLRNYKTKRESPLSTNYLEAWTKNAQTLQILLEEMLSTIQYVFTQRYARSPRTLKTTANSAEVVRAIEVVEDITERLLDRVDQCDWSHHELWGGSSANWYTFGVMLNVFFGHYLLMESPKHLIRVVKFLKAYLPEPNQVTTTRYERPYESCLLGPWLLRHHFDGSLDVALTSDVYKKARAKLFPQLVNVANTNGLHIDLSYYAYGNAVAFNVMQEMVGPRSRMVYFLDSSLAGQQTYISVYHAVTDLICHPSIGLGNLGVFGRRATDKCEYKSSAPYGIWVLPCASMLVYKTARTHFTVRGQRPNTAFYVADRTNYNYGLYWVQMRQRYRLDSKPTDLSSGKPAPGMICVKGKDALVPLKPNEPLGLSMPTDAISCVFAWENFGVMYQHYNIKEFGGYEVDELVVVDSMQNVITVCLTIRNTTRDTTFEYYGENGLRAVIEPGQIRSFRSRLYEDRSNDSIGINEHTISETPLSIGRTANSNQIIELCRSNNQFLLTVDGVPKVTIPPDGNEQEQQTIKYNGNKMKLRFDDKLNQWLVVG